MQRGAERDLSSGNAVEQIRDGDIELLYNRMKRRESDVGLPAFYLAHVGPMKAAQIGEGFLGHLLLFAPLFNAGAHSFLHSQELAIFRFTGHRVEGPFDGGGKG